MSIQQNTDHIQSTHIGSLPRPHDLLDLMKAKYAGELYDRARFDAVRDFPSAGTALAIITV